ncbi:MAG: excinuclease ABC subunit UvrA [Pirellulales bacterium]|nr:excinuclease ABC subunit UvrA [Pirellulales bacterium]
MSDPSHTPEAAGVSSAVAVPNANPDVICIRGARVHNLQNINLDIPHRQLVVITGLSGSGKSSLAFDTIFAEGQRQYIDSLSVYSRQFLQQLERPDVDEIEGLQPTIAIDQRQGARNPRSTVATVTEIYDYLRLLYARLGEATCYQCGAPIRQQSPDQILEELQQLPEKTRAMIMAPFVRGRKGQHREVFEAIRKAGFVRTRVDGDVYDIDVVPELVRQRNHTIEAVVDRVVVRPGLESRIAESLHLALKHGEGVAVVAWLPADETAKGAGAQSGVWQEKLFSTEAACPDCKISFAQLEPRSFSFNSPYGACPTCEGLGYRVEFDPELVLAESQSLESGAILPWRNGAGKLARQHKQLVADFAAEQEIASDAPLANWKIKHRELLWNGDGREFLGLGTLLQQEYVTATDAHERERLERFRGQVRCADCGGARLRPEACSVRVAGRAIHEVVALSVEEARGFFAGLHFARTAALVGDPLLTEIRRRLDFLYRVGLAYLTLERAADTLSGGESQRIRLTSGLSSGLVDVCYVLDEPSIGLHQRDNQRLIAAVRELVEQGNSAVVVEHDESMMRVADRLIDLGPGAGRHGGRVVAEGTPDEVASRGDSLTGRYLSGLARIEVPDARRATSVKRSIVLEGVTTNNLKQVDARFPLGALVCVTGVSGSGKSSLINETLGPALMRRLGQAAPKPGPHASLRGASQIEKLIEVDQSPIGRGPRSNLATYSGVWDELRKVFAGTREAKLRGYRVGRFSFNVAGGRCEQCEGQGLKRIEMNFLPDIYVPCPVCGGDRFNRQTLEVRYRGLNVADVLKLSVDEALEFFANFPAIVRLLASFADVGLGYLTLGQASTSLSGGEAQRIKLATELARPSTNRTLYLLDEPTTGLHFQDIKRLLAVLGRLVDAGGTVIVIEHNLDVIKCADWVIDLGPEGGAQGGYVLAAGAPEQVAATGGNETGRFLVPMLPASARTPRG